MNVLSDALESGRTSFGRDTGLKRDGCAGSGSADSIAAAAGAGAGAADDIELVAELDAAEADGGAA